MKVKILPVTNGEYQKMDIEGVSKLGGSVKTVSLNEPTAYGIACLLRREGISYKDICKYTIVEVRKMGCTHYFESEEIYKSFERIDFKPFY